MVDEYSPSIIIAPPLNGAWKCLCPPGHHPDAYDFVQTSSNRKHTHKSKFLNFIFSHIASSEYYCWGQPVLSPVDGTVIRASDGWVDHQYTSLWRTIVIWYYATYRFRPKEKDGVLDIRPNAGNHIMIKTEAGHIVFLAHLKSGSVLVKEGQSVKTGEHIALVGNSGNATAPHLHINIFDQMHDPYTSKVLAFVFDEYQSLNEKKEWVKKSLSVPNSGEFVNFVQKTRNE